MTMRTVTFPFATQRDNDYCSLDQLSARGGSTRVQPVHILRPQKANRDTRAPTGSVAEKEPASAAMDAIAPSDAGKLSLPEQTRPTVSARLASNASTGCS